jgi:hypothetical protein
MDQRGPPWPTHAHATAIAAAALTPVGRGSDARRSKKWWNERVGCDLRQGRQVQQIRRSALQRRLGDRQRQRLEALDQTAAHIGANLLWAIGTWLCGLVTGHLTHCRSRCGLRPRHCESVSRRHRHGNERPEHGDHAEDHRPAVELTFSHGIRVPHLTDAGNNSCRRFADQ